LEAYRICVFIQSAGTKMELNLGRVRFIRSRSTRLPLTLIHTFLRENFRVNTLLYSIALFYAQNERDYWTQLGVGECGV